MALLAIGAFALREGELGRAVDTDNPTATLTVAPTGIDLPEEPVNAVSVRVGVTPTEGIPEITGAEHNLLEGEFVPITEEPFVPGMEQEEETVTPTPVKTAEEEEKGPEEQQEEVLSTDNLKLYIVQDGDTLAGICRGFYGNTLRMEEVKGLNQIPDENRIYAGQELYLP